METPTEMVGSANRAAALRPLARILPLLLAAAACGRPTAPAGPVPRSAAAAPARVELVLLGTTDVHGRIHPYDYFTGRTTDHGLALLAPLIDSVRAANPGRTFLFDSGDLLQGTPLTLLTARPAGAVGAGGVAGSGSAGVGAGGETGNGYSAGRAGRAGEGAHPVIRAMNLLGYDAAAIGNHEYNYGIEALERARSQAEFAFVAANVYRHGTAEHAYPAYVLLEHVAGPGDTILVGVSATTPPGVNIWDRANVEGQLEFRDAAGSLAPVVREMRARGADLVVVLHHGGFEGTSYDTAATGLAAENQAARIAREVPGVDVILLGHTHGEIADTTAGGVLIAQARAWARSLVRVAVTMEREAPGRWRVAAKEGRILRPDPAHADTALLDSTRWAHERAVAWVKTPIGRSTAGMEARRARVEDTPILDFINEVQRRVTGADLSATAAFNTGATLPEGEITVADVAGLYIYDNTLVAVRVTGEQLRQYLEQSATYYRGWPAPGGGPVVDPRIPGYNFDVVSGVDYTIDLARPAGERIVGLSFEGRPVRPDQAFTLALNNYRQSGGGGFGMLAGAPVVYDRQEDIRGLLIEEVRRRRTIRPEDYFRRNWRLVPEAAAAPALREQEAAERAHGGAHAAGVAPERPRLRLLTTNDFHGRLEPQRGVGGAATLAGLLAAESAGFAGPVLLLDAGDLMQGTPISNLTDGRATIEYYNAAGYDAAAIGNHDFDWGQEVLRERMQQARFPWLAANVVVAGTDTAPSWIRPVAVIEYAPSRTVGVIGLAFEGTPWVTKASNVAGLEFTNGAAAIDRWVPELRARGVDFVIVLAHGGAECDAAGAECRGEIIDWAHQVTHRPDLMVGGHTHHAVRTRVRGVPIVESGSHGTRYGVVDLERIGADSVHAWIRGIPAALAGLAPPDSAVGALVERHGREIEPLVERIVATAAAPLPRAGDQYALGNLIADAQRAATGAQVAIMNNGGIRAALEAGPVTWGELQQVQPFENRLVRLHVTSEQLRRTLEHAVAGDGPGAHVSGVIVEYDATRPAGQRITSLRLESGEEVRPEATYTVGATDFLAGRGDGYPLGEAARVEDAGILDLDALIEYIQRLPQPFTAPAEPRIREGRARSRSRARSRGNGCSLRSPRARSRSRARSRAHRRVVAE